MNFDQKRAYLVINAFHIIFSELNYFPYLIQINSGTRYNKQHTMNSYMKPNLTYIYEPIAFNSKLQ